MKNRGLLLFLVLLSGCSSVGGLGLVGNYLTPKHDAACEKQPDGTCAVKSQNLQAIGTR